MTESNVQRAPGSSHFERWVRPTPLLRPPSQFYNPSMEHTITELKETKRQPYSSESVGDAQLDVGK